MPPKRSARLATDEALPREKARALVHVSLRHALKATRTSIARAATSMGIAESTLTRWLQKRTPVLVEAVLCSERLAVPFALCLTAAVRKVRKARRA